MQLSDLDAILHGSTVVTNLILESKGATGGLLTTQGHEQLLHLARAWTPGPLYGWMGMIKPPPMVELWRTRTVSARMSAAGEVVREFDEAEVRAALEELAAAGAESLTIAFLNSYVNPEHERRARDIALSAFPDLPVSISSDLVSEYREYERTLTAVLNAYAKPQVTRYVDGLESLLNEAGFSGRLDIVRSDGGTMSVASTKERPIDIALSGPSGGAVGAAYLAREIDLPDVLTIDMGGTSTDVSLCEGGTPPIKRDAQLGYYQFQSRSVDIHSVGAGGGSIAYLTNVGSLRVGPAQRGRRPRSRLLRARRHRADGDRRQRRPAPDPAGLQARRHAGDRRGGGQDGRADDRRRARGGADRGGRGDPHHRQREHARRPARGVGRARL